MQLCCHSRLLKPPIWKHVMLMTYFLPFHMINGTLKDQQSFVRNKRKAECGTLRAGGLFCVYVWHTVSCQKSKNAYKSVICAGQLKQVVERKLDNAQRLLSLLFLVCFHILLETCILFLLHAC